jgi:hypothetical protein
MIAHEVQYSVRLTPNDKNNMDHSALNQHHPLEMAKALIPWCSVPLCFAVINIGDMKDLAQIFMFLSAGLGSIILGIKTWKSIGRKRYDDD